MSSSLDAVLDRLAPTTSAAAADGPSYIPASSWQGSKPGYYFGTSDQGTGYYKDDKHVKGSASSSDPTNKKPKKKSVSIQEDQNELRFLKPETTSLTPETMLKQAEQAAKGSLTIELTPRGLKSSTNALEKIVAQNALQRAEHADDPTQYMESELQLYDHVTSLQAIAASLNLYNYLLEGEKPLLQLLIQLLTHANTDIAASVIALFLEWVDPSLLDEDERNMSNMTSLAKTILEEAWETIVQNLGRFSIPQSETTNSGEDRGVYDDDDPNLKGTDNVLSLLGNLLELDLVVTPSLGGILGDETQSVAAFVVQQTDILGWLLAPLDDADENAGGSTTTEEFQNRCMELLSLLMQRDDVHLTHSDFSKIPKYTPTAFDEDDSTEPPKKKAKVNEEGAEKTATIDGIELLLQAIGRFRKKQPSNEDEVEYLENSCMVLSSCLTFSTSNVEAFLKGQGIELVLRCLKERVHAGGTALKLLDFFGSESVHKQSAEHLVAAGGLKYIFPLFLGTRLPKPYNFEHASKKTKREWKHSIESHSIRVLYCLVRHLDDKSPDDSKARLIAKFVEDESKCDRLVELLLQYDQKARQAEYQFYRSGVEDEMMDEDAVQLAALDAKLQGGGELCHRLGAIAAYLCAQSIRCHERILNQLKLQQSGISLIKATVEEFASVLGPGPHKEQLDGYLSKII